VIFTEPTPFAEAIQANAVRSLLPTDLRTEQLAAIEPELLARARVSAGVTSANLLQEIDDQVAALTDGKIDRASAREQLKKLLGSLGHEVDETDLTDLRSTSRLNLILDTNLAQAQGYGQALQGAQPEVLDEWPAQELVRVRDSAEPRDWAARWLAAGGIFFAGRMVALKASPVWAKLSRFGNPYPPFDFNSGMDVVDVTRDEAEDLGLLEPDAPAPAPELPDFNAELQATPEVRADWLRSALAQALQGFAKFDADGVLKLTGGAS
jgi:hypothetical protein